MAIYTFGMGLRVCFHVSARRFAKFHREPEISRGTTFEAKAAAISRLRREKILAHLLTEKTISRLFPLAHRIEGSI